MVWGAAVGTGRDHEGALRAGVVHFMVVDDDDVHTAGTGEGDVFVITAGTVGGDEQGDPRFGESFDSAGVQPIAVDSGRDDRLQWSHAGGGCSERVVNDREGANPVGVVVAIETDALFICDGLQGAVSGGGHSGEGEGVWDWPFAEIEEFRSERWVSDPLPEERIDDRMRVERFWARWDRGRVHPNELRHGAAFLGVARVTGERDVYERF